MPTLLQIQPRQYYTEFHPEAVITQPWNTWTSLLFLVPVIFWLIALRKRYRHYLVLVAILPLAVANGIGSALWHAYSGGQFFLNLDIYPPRIMLGFLGVYFCRLITGNWLLGLVAFASFALGVNHFKEEARPLLGVGWVTFNYIFNSIIVITPALVVVFLYRGKGVGYLLLTLILLLGAVYFRWLDGHRPYPSWLPRQGTHFLWHVLCAAAYFPLGAYLIVLEKKRRARRQARRQRKAHAQAITGQGTQQ